MKCLVSYGGLFDHRGYAFLSEFFSFSFSSYWRLASMEVKLGCECVTETNQG